MIGVVALVAIIAAVPATTHAKRDGALQGELSAFASKQVWLSTLVTVLSPASPCSGPSPTSRTPLTKVSGFPTIAAPWPLILFGIGLFIGSAAGRKAADRSGLDTHRALGRTHPRAAIFAGPTAERSMGAYCPRSSVQAGADRIFVGNTSPNKDEQSARQSAKQPTRQPTEQPIKQPTKQPTKQPRI